MSDVILLVEDDVDILKANARLLQRRNYTVLTAGTVVDAIDMLKQSTPDLIALDIMLPDGSGYEVCKFFREYSDKPIIFLSAKGEAESKISGLKCGADYYLTKPYEPDVFFAVIERLLERAHSNAQKHPTVIAVGQLRIHLHTSTVTLAGKVINLTKIEFALLSYLMQNKNKIVSNQVLCDLVWNDAFPGYKSSLKAHISRIRQKINCESSISYDIRAIYGTGYSLVTE